MCYTQIVPTKELQGVHRNDLPHLTPDELGMIESYFKIKESVASVARQLKRSRQNIHKVYQCFKQAKKALDYYQQYKQNKALCGRQPIVLPTEQADYVKKMTAQDCPPDVIVGRTEFPINCFVCTLYRMFEKGLFNVLDLPLKGKRKSNGHQEKRGKQAFRRSIHQRKRDHANYSEEFVHLEGDTIVGVKHKSAVITLVERLSKVIITLKPQGRQAIDIENRLNQWFESVPKHLFRSITFDCGKSFPIGKTLVISMILTFIFQALGLLHNVA